MFSWKGFAELEYGMLRLMGAVDDDTPALRMQPAGIVAACMRQSLAQSRLLDPVGPS